jgi:hypothetical protein
MNGTVFALTVFDDGGGPSLYAGGFFTQAGGNPANRTARWNGTTWSSLGSGVNDWVYALAPYDDGTGPALYAAGDFSQAGGRPANRIAKWTAPNWSAVGDGLSGGFAGLALTTFEDDSGPALFVGGGFSQAGGSDASNIARWGNSCITPPCPADVTGDDTINLADLNLVLANFGATTPDGDTNDDGVIDLADLNAVLAAFGSDCP